MPSRPQPHFPEPDTKHYWDGIKAGELRYQTCDDCAGAVNFYPAAHCRQCGGANLTWHTSRGEGTVYTFSVVMQNRIPGFQELGAYAVAYVDLDEGFRMLTNVVGAKDPTKDIAIGQRVRVEYEPQDTGEYPIPVFRAV